MTQLPRIIGLAGYGRSGKNTVAEILRDRYGYETVAWADRLRMACEALNPIVGVKLYLSGRVMMVRPGAPVYVRWADLYQGGAGYEAAKDHPVYGEEFRGIMLRLGTEAGRQTLGENVWVNALLDNLDPDKRYAIADTRFPNEVGAVRKLGGVVWRVERPGYGAVANHDSETAVLHMEMDFTLLNHSDLLRLRNEVDVAVHAYTAGRRAA